MGRHRPSATRWTSVVNLHGNLSGIRRADHLLQPDGQLSQDRIGLVRPWPGPLGTTTGGGAFLPPAACRCALTAVESADTSQSIRPRPPRPSGHETIASSTFHQPTSAMPFIDRPQRPEPLRQIPPLHTRKRAASRGLAVPDTVFNRGMPAVADLDGRTTPSPEYEVSVRNISADALLVRTGAPRQLADPVVGAISSPSRVTLATAAAVIPRGEEREDRLLDFLLVNLSC